MEKIISTTLSLLMLAVFFGSTSEKVEAQTSWTPPIGIPAPTFGLTQQAPAAPSSWTTNVAGFYYIDTSHPASTDTSNTYGYPAKPRKTIPKPVPAGSVVEMRGSYNAPHDGGFHLEFKGTATNPVFIRGESPTNRPKITSKRWDIEYSSYFILENLDFDFNVPCCRGNGLGLFRDVSFGVIRNSDLSGNDYGGGINMSGVTNSVGGPSNILIYKNKISHSGQWLIGTAGYDCTPGTTWVNGTFWAGDGGKTNPASGCDHDIHGINVGYPASYIWVLENEIFNSSGNGMQINAGTNLGSGVHHIYVGENVVHENKQAGLWTKQSTDVIISENTVYSHLIPSQGNPQAGIGGQYSPERVWILHNFLFNNQVGIRQSTDEDGNGTTWFAIGNVIYGNHNADPAWDPNSPWSSAGISIAGDKLNRYILNNIIYDVDAGIYQVRDGTASLIVKNNIIGKLKNLSSKHIYIEQPGLASRSYFINNILEGTPKIRWGSSVDQSLSQFETANSTRAAGNLNADPKFVDAANFNFRLQSTSQGIDRGVNLTDLVNAFKSYYGLDINLDPDKVLRPQGAAWDIGVYEYLGSSPSTPVIGDINLDHIVNSIDYSIMNTDWFTTNARSDLNNDGLVNAIDYSLLNSNWFRTW